MSGLRCDAGGPAIQVSLEGGDRLVVNGGV